ncbi:MAG: aldehyde ferredoxin oxidoreductase family protein [Anaerolineae bacterium]|nr:aldehyde ferredoxin oxidoreductase family protein [Anaerolineae bacterium]
MAKTAFVDLSSGVVRLEQSDPALLEMFLGGRGYASKLLYDRVPPDVQPLSPENLLIFSMGMMGGTPWPTASRGHVTFKSPVTGAYGHANSGGYWGAELARAGYDALVIKGKASQPVYLYVTDDGVEIRQAGDLWGLEITPVTQRLESLGKVACIGPAGENLVNFAAIMNDYSRAAARSGSGAVMGSKLLKAVVVKAAGKKNVPEAYLKKIKELSQRMRDDRNIEELKRYGTSILVEIQNMSGALPSRNHQRVQVPFVEKVGAFALDKYVLRGKGCFSCPVHCGRVTKIPQGEYACDTGGPEYESMSALGPMTWNSNIESVVYANLRCNELGLDTISTGVTIAFAMECAENGLLKDDELSLEWGDVKTELTLIEKIARREGIGNLLADGTRLAAKAIGGGAERFAMQVKGLELPRQDPRVAKGFGMAHAVGNRGADHLYALPTIDAAGLWETARHYFPEEMLDELMDTVNEKYKPDIVILGEHFCALVDSLGICKLASVENFAITPEDLADGLSELLGKKVTAEELLLIGERVVNLERMYNVRHGYSRKDDYLPERFMKEPVNVWEYTPNPETGWGTPSEKPIRENVVIRDLDAMLDRYYSLRGWSQDGIPADETLRRLKLL